MKVFEQSSEPVNEFVNTESLDMPHLLKKRVFARSGLIGLAACMLVGCSSSPEPVAPAPAKPEEPAAKPFEILNAADDDVTTRGALLAPMPVAVTSFGAAVSGEHAYVLGGYFGEPHKYHREAQSNALWRLGFGENGRWQQVGQLDAGLQGLALVAYGDEVCRVGGNRILNEEGTPAKMQSVAEAACFHTEQRTWRQLPAMPSGRSSHEAAVIDGVLYVAGGWQLGSATEGGGARSGRFHEDILALDLKAQEPAWRSIAVPFKRRAVGVANVGGKLAVLGGLGQDRKVSKRLDLFDPAKQTWSSGPELPVNAFGVAAVGVGDALYASARDGVLHHWRLGQSEWSSHTKLAFPRFFHQLLPSEDKLVAVGGISGMHTAGRTRHVEVIPLSETGATLAEWTMPYPGRAKNRQGVMMYGDSLFLFGGNNSLGQHDFEPDNFLAEGWRMHLPSMKWDKAPSYPHKRQTMQTLSLGETGISVGGFGHNGKAAVSHLEAYQIDFRTGTWTPGPSLPRGRTQFGLAAYGGKLWAFGGLNYDPARPGRKAFQHVTNTLVSSPKPPPAKAPAAKGPAPKASAAKAAAAKASGHHGHASKDEPMVTYGTFEEAGVELPATRRAFAGAVLGDNYYIVGGMRERFQLVEDCLVYNFPKKTFSELPCPTKNRLSAKMVVMDGKLFVLGGSVRVGKKMTPERSVEMYDPATKKWTQVIADVGFDTKHMRAMRYGDQLMMISTHQQEQRIRVVLLKP